MRESIYFPITEYYELFQVEISRNYKILQQGFVFSQFKYLGSCTLPFVDSPLFFLFIFPCDPLF